LAEGFWYWYVLQREIKRENQFVDASKERGSFGVKGTLSNLRFSKEFQVRGVVFLLV